MSQFLLLSGHLINRRRLMPDELKWGWMYIDAEAAHGEFDTREEAIKDAMNDKDENGVVTDDSFELVVGRCVYPDPTNYLDDDLDDLLERMDQRACDGDFGFWEDEIFTVADPKAAQEDLTKALAEWAKKHIRKPDCWTLESTEKVIIGKVDDRSIEEKV